MTTYDLAQRLGDGRWRYTLWIHAQGLMVRLASVRDGRLWVGLLSFLVLAARWKKFREARVEGDLPVRQ